MESNFVVELALGQETAPYAMELLRLAEADAVQLAIPVFSVCEPFGTLMVRGRKRKELADKLSSQLRDLSRSSPHASAVVQLTPTPALLAGIEKAEMDGLERVIRRVLASAKVLPLTLVEFDAAVSYQREHDLSQADSIILACIVAHLRTCDTADPKCFISRNTKDFDDPELIAELMRHNCQYFGAFDEGLRFVQSILGASS